MSNLFGGGAPGPGPDPTTAALLGAIQGGGGQDTGGGQPGAPDSQEAAQALNDAIDALNHFLQVEQDAQDKAVASKCLASLQGILGGRQQEQQAALGMTPVHKAMARSTQALGY